MARSSAPLLRTGRTPGSARSTADACELGGAPNAVDAPEKIFDAVLSCACVSNPMTISQSMLFLSFSVSPCLRGSALYKCRRPARMPVGRALEHVRRGEHACFIKIIADDLQSHRPPLGTEAAGNRHPRKPREVDRDRVKVVEVHLHGIVALRREVEGDRRRRRADDEVALLERFAEVARDEPADALRLEGVRIV